MPINILSISQKEAAEVLDAIVKKAYADNGAPVAAAVVDAAGRLIAFAAMDGLPPASIKLSQNKAYSAVLGQKDTIHWASFPKNELVVDFDMRNWTDENFSGFTGGIVITYSGRIIGGIGVSGRKGKMEQADSLLQDNELAYYGKSIFENKLQSLPAFNGMGNIEPVQGNGK